MNEDETEMVETVETVTDATEAEETETQDETEEVDPAAGLKSALQKERAARKDAEKRLLDQPGVHG